MYKFLILAFLGLFGSENETTVDELHDQCLELLDSNIEDARALANQAYELSVEQKYDWGKAHSLFIMAYCDDDMNHLNKAVPEYLKALEGYEAVGTKRADLNQAKVYKNLGIIFDNHYKYADAINFYERGYKIAAGYNDITLMKKILHSKAIAYRHSGDLVKAAETQFLRLSLDEGANKSSDVKSYNQLGLIHTDLKNFTEARGYFDHILKLESSKKESIHRARAYHNIAMTYSLEERNQDAELMLIKALAEKKIIGNNKDLFVTYLDLTDLYINLSNLDKAEIYGLKAKEIVNDLMVSIDNNKINHYLSQIYFSKNQPEKAKLYFDRYVTQMESLYDQQKELASQGDQYKIELITSTYFAKIQEQEKINYYMVGVAGLVVFFILFLIYNRYRKVAAAKMLREHFSSISFNISNTSSK